MKKVLVFGGTAEGRSIADCLDQNGIPHTVCVATEYGQEVLARSPLRTIRRGRLTEEEMETLLAEGAFAAVVDATHPYALEVSQNVKSACLAEGVPCLRYLRPAGEKEACRETGPEQGTGRPGRISVASALEAARYLEARQGGIFLTTGSKELPIFMGQISDLSRIFARVLPSAEVVSSCRDLGLTGKQICAMQGPFSEELNRAMLRETGAAYLVTKDTGAAGGFPEKERAAAALGVTLVVIQRPEEAGIARESLLKELSRILGREMVESGPSVAQKRTGSILPVESAETERGCSGADRRPGPAGSGVPEGRGSEAAGSVVPEGRGSDAAGCGGSEGRRPDPAGSGGPEDRQAPAGKRSICCIGIGMGTPDTLTREAEEAIREAQILFGAGRILESVKPLLRKGEASALPQQELPKDSSERPHKTDILAWPALVPEYEGKRIAAYLDAHPGYSRIAVLMSGDVGFYSGARGIGEAFPGEDVRYLCGISSVVYFASKIPTAWQDARLVSAHGKEVNLLNLVQRFPKLFLLVSSARDVERFCGELHAAGLEEVRVTVGSNLSYPEETVTAGVPADFLQYRSNGLHIMLLENSRAVHRIVPGIPDGAFVRGKVPMTKEEIRILSVSKLRLLEDAAVYDVGAGTGSVAAECARLCTLGKVYAIEKNPEGIRLIQENCRRMRLSNVIPVEGTAPEALESLPAPTHVFLGGSSGNMGRIMDAVQRKNPSVRIVLNIIALESLTEILAFLEERGIRDADIVQVCAAKSRSLGRYHMMEARNPVYIVSFGGGDLD